MDNNLYYLVHKNTLILIKGKTIRLIYKNGLYTPKRYLKKKSMARFFNQQQYKLINRNQAVNFNTITKKLINPVQLELFQQLNMF